MLEGLTRNESVRAVLERNPNNLPGSSVAELRPHEGRCCGACGWRRDRPKAFCRYFKWPQTGTCGPETPAQWAVLNAELTSSAAPLPQGQPPALPPAQLRLGVEKYLLLRAVRNSKAATENLRQLQDMRLDVRSPLSRDARKQLEALEVEQVRIHNREIDAIEDAVDTIFEYMGDYSITKEEAEKKVKDIIWRNA